MEKGGQLVKCYRKHFYQDCLSVSVVLKSEEFLGVSDDVKRGNNRQYLCKHFEARIQRG